MAYPRSLHSNELSGTPLLQPILRAIRNNDGTGIELSWSQTTSGATYTLNSGTTQGSLTTVESTNASQPFSLSGLGSGASYYYRVSAVNTNGSLASTDLAVPPNTLSFSPSTSFVGSVLSLSGLNFTSAINILVGGAAPLNLNLGASSASLMILPGSTSGSVRLTIDNVTFEKTGLSLNAPAVPSTQQGTKLVGTGASGAAQQGESVAISADGNTIASGGPIDNTNKGAGWIFVRSGTSWSQQGSKLTGSDVSSGTIYLGASAAMSANGNTVAFGGREDSSGIGATWVFVRSGTSWSQQGSKLVGTGGVGTSNQGVQVALSADGHTLVHGGYKDDSFKGAAWVFVRSGSTWSQQGSKLVGSGAVGASQQGNVAISADGQRFALGGHQDNSAIGATWIFKRSVNVWTQEGSKLVGTGRVGNSLQGTNISLNADGSILAVGGGGDNSNAGAVWIFERTSETWSQVGSKLVGTGAVGSPQLGRPASLSAAGTILLAGGHGDNSNVGAIWTFDKFGSNWAQNGTKIVPSGNVGAPVFGLPSSLSADGSTAVVGGRADNSNTGAAWIFVAP